jgi:hypothetical protein
VRSFENDIEIFKESSYASKFIDSENGGGFREEYSESILPYE